PTRVATYSSNDFLNVACWRRSKASTAGSCVTPPSAWLITSGETPAACASAEKFWMKALKLPPQRAAKEGVMSKALSKIPKQSFRMKNPNVLVMAGLRPGHPRLCCNQRKTWMPGSSPGMTTEKALLTPSIDLAAHQRDRLL